ncbi:MAG: phosphoribulokinase [Gammaproteobacteria bacterium]|nr:phosphoribulokinase [Gammaproteobacteria bacterium]
MSVKNPIIAITGSSGSGSHRVGTVFSHIAWRQKIKPLIFNGSAFHSYERDAMQQAVKDAVAKGRHLSHFSPDGNRLDLLASFLSEYAETGKGRYRDYLHTESEVREAGGKLGGFTDWKQIPGDTDLLVYQGLHGAYRDDDVDISQLADFTIGVAPIVNLEWIQKIHNDTLNRGYSLEEVKSVINNRLIDYVRYITPQFTNTDVNFQRVPLVDTSNPFVARDVPSCDESVVILHFRHPETQDFSYLMKMIQGSFMSRRNTVVVPGGKMEYAMELVLSPVVKTMMEKRRQLLETG